VWVSCKRTSRPFLVARITKNLTYEGMPDTKKVDLRTQFRCIHALQFMNLHLRASTPQPSHEKRKKKKEKRKKKKTVEDDRDRDRAVRARTFFPSKKKPKVGVAVTQYSRATIETIPTPKSTLTNAIWPLVIVKFLFFDRARSSNTGSIILRAGGRIPEVNIAKTVFTWVLYDIWSTSWHGRILVDQCQK
jgi:hypothetical protein